MTPNSSTLFKRQSNRSPNPMGSHDAPTATTSNYSFIFLINIILTFPTLPSSSIPLHIYINFIYLLEFHLIIANHLGIFHRSFSIGRPSTVTHSFSSSSDRSTRSNGCLHIPIFVCLTCISMGSQFIWRLRTFD